MMEALVILVALVCYSVALFLWWRHQQPIFLVGLVAGHVGALSSSLWPQIYPESYRADLSVLFSLFDLPIYTTLFIAAAWYFTLPGLIVTLLYLRRWWQPSYLVALVTYGGFLLYHILLERIGINNGFWNYATVTPLAFGLSQALLAALMSSIISLIFLYVLLLVRRFALLSLLLTLLPALLFANLLVRGLLGAPLWVSLLLGTTQDWILLVGTTGTLLLLVWATHITLTGLSRVELPYRAFD